MLNRGKRNKEPDRCIASCCLGPQSAVAILASLNLPPSHRAHLAVYLAVFTQLMIAKLATIKILNKKQRRRSKPDALGIGAKLKSMWSKWKYIKLKFIVNKVIKLFSWRHITLGVKKTFAFIYLWIILHYLTSFLFTNSSTSSSYFSNSNSDPSIFYVWTPLL